MLRRIRATYLSAELPPRTNQPGSVETLEECERRFVALVARYRAATGVDTLDEGAHQSTARNGRAAASCLAAAIVLMHRARNRATAGMLERIDLMSPTSELHWAERAIVGIERGVT